MWIVTVFVILESCFVLGRLNSCPEVCFCNKLKKIIYCSRRGLQSIPTADIPADSLQLNFHGNIFEQSTIKRGNFSKFVQLEHLYLSECGIEKIEVDTFHDLRNLQWLDLSNNRIKLIEDYTFRGLSLMHLFLNGNRNINLRRNAFSGLATTGLYLHECSLPRLSLDVFTHLNNTLTNLWLFGNELTKIEKRFLPLFMTLSHIRLGSNPFHCNCEILWLKEFYDKNGEKFEGAAPPSCLSPSNKKGELFSDISLLDFRCQAPHFTNIDVVIKDNKGMLRCNANGDPAPRLFWVQPSGLSTLYKQPSNESVHSNTALINISAENSRHNDLSGSYFCIAVNDAGNMTFTFNVTWPMPRLDQSYKYKTITTDVGVRTIPENNTEVDIWSILSGLLSTTPMPTDPTPAKTAKPKVTETPQGKSHINESSHNVVDNGDSTEVKKMFTLTELIGAVVGTHVFTLILCLILIPLYFKRGCKSNSQQHGVGKKPSMQEVRFLNGMGSHGTQSYPYRDYYEGHGSLKR